MGSLRKTFTIIKNQETIIDLNNIYVNYYWTSNDLYLDYEQNFVIGNFFTNSTYLPTTTPNLPNWLSIYETQNINTLNNPLYNFANIYQNFFYNDSDFIKKIKVKIQNIGTYTIRFWALWYKSSTGQWGYSINEYEFKVVDEQSTNYNKYDRVIRVEVNKTTQVSFGTDGLFPNGEQLIINSTLPAWITNNTINSYTQFWSLAPTSIGTFYYNASAYLRNSFEGAALITVIVVESLYEEIDNCCSDENVNIVWLNRQGGRGNYIFTQRKDFNVEVGKTNTYISNDIKRYSEIKNVHNGFKVYAKGISKNQIDFLDTLRYSIQCWQFINGVFVPLILDIGSFEKYNTKENMYEISMNFLYAERLNIQRQ